jgi:hypothetical protein
VVVGGNEQQNGRCRSKHQTKRVATSFDLRVLLFFLCAPRPLTNQMGGQMEQQTLIEPMQLPYTVARPVSRESLLRRRG